MLEIMSTLKKTLVAAIPLATYSLHFFHVDNKKRYGGIIEVNPEKKSMKLEQVQILFRHGARTSFKSEEHFERFTNFDPVTWERSIFMKVPPCVADVEYSVLSVDGHYPLKPERYSKCLKGGSTGGALTTMGHKDAYDFGCWLADEYIKKHQLLSPLYTIDTSNDIYIRSTLSERAILTGVGVMAGLYGKDNLKDHILIYARASVSENICPNWKNCKRIYPRFRYHWDNITDDIMEINNEMGLKEGAKPLNHIDIYDIITQRSNHGLHVPEFLLERKEEIHEKAMNLMLTILGTSVEEQRHSIGSFVDTVCSRIEEAITGECRTKLLLYPSHDTAVISFLNVLGIFDSQWPPYVSNVIIELHRDTQNKRYIRVLHNRKLVVLDQESGEEFMPVEKFMNLVEKYRVKDWSENCGNDL